MSINIKIVKSNAEKSFNEIKIQSQKIPFVKVKTKTFGEQHKPSLPTPKLKDTDSKKISFTKKIKEIKNVSDYLFDKDDVKPAVVGEKCFDLILKESK